MILFSKFFINNLAASKSTFPSIPLNKSYTSKSVTFTFIFSKSSLYPDICRFISDILFFKLRICFSNSSISFLFNFILLFIIKNSLFFSIKSFICFFFFFNFFNILLNNSLFASPLLLSILSKFKPESKSVLFNPNFIVGI